jgi:hypothetical protein
MATNNNTAGQSNLQIVSGSFLNTLLAKNKYGLNNEYNAGNKDALSPIGKGENNGNIGDADDITDRTVELKKNTYGPNNEYNAGND